jgi:hypothetical protein
VEDITELNATKISQRIQIWSFVPSEEMERPFSILDPKS